MCGHGRHHHHHHRRTTVETTTTVEKDHIRASDAERERVVDDLRAHAGEGRLSVDELDRRIGAVYAATTRKDLAALTADLPRRPRAPRDAAADFREHLRVYLMVMALLVAIWALTGAGYFWPVWPALGWGIGVFAHAPRRARRPVAG